jgi:DNA polymerase-1
MPLNQEKDKNMRLIIDGNGLAYRACAKILKEPLINARGENVTGLYTLIAMTRDIIRRFDDTTEITFVWDGSGSAAKLNIHPEYKAQRIDNDYVLAVRKQIPIIQNALLHFGVKQLRFEHIEADDVIGILSNALSANNHEVVVVSSDKDMLQLINGNCSIYSHAKQKLITYANFDKLIGIPNPRLTIEYLSILGDESDNIKGIYGIGETWGKKIIRKFGTVETVASKEAELKLSINLNSDDKQLAKKALLLLTKENREKITLNRSLIKLGDLLTVEDKKTILKEYIGQKPQFDREAVLKIFDHYQLIEFARQIIDIENCFKSIQLQDIM